MDQNSDNMGSLGSEDNEPGHFEITGKLKYVTNHLMSRIMSEDI